MYNWRLLLFAYFAVVQPIASFAERNLVDGRQQCCDHRRTRDTGDLNGNFPLKLSTEDRLNYQREIRETRRDDVRNERSVLIRSAKDAVREVRERQLSRSEDFESRISRTVSKRMNNRATPPAIRIDAVRDTETNRDERSFARDSLSRTSTKGRRDRTAENLSRSTRRDTNQREVLRLMPRHNIDARRETQRVDEIRRSFNERKSARDLEMRSSTRNDLRQQHLITQSDQSLERFTSDIKEYRRSSLEVHRNTRSELRNIRHEAARAEVRAGNRIDFDRRTSSRSLKRQQDNRANLYGQTNEILDSRMNHETRNNVRDDRRMEDRIVREVVERFMPIRAVEFIRLDANMERNTERLIPAERRRNVENAAIRNSRIEYRENNRDTLRFITREDRRENSNTVRHMMTTRPENILNDNAEERTNLRTRDYSMLVTRTRSLDNRREQRTTRDEARRMMITRPDNRLSENREEITNLRSRENSMLDTRTPSLENRRNQRITRNEARRIITTRPENRLNANAEERTILQRTRENSMRITRTRSLDNKREQRTTRNEARRMIIARPENRLSDNREERSSLRTRDHSMLITRTRSLENRREQRPTQNERENGRAFDENQRMVHNEYRNINERTRSLEREQLKRDSGNKVRSPIFTEMERRFGNDMRVREQATAEVSRLSSRNSRVTKLNVLSEKPIDNSRAMNSERRVVYSRMKPAAVLSQNIMEQNEVNANNWQYLMYTLQGIYLCTIFLPMLMHKDGAKKKMYLNWGIPLQKFIKVD